MSWHLSRMCGFDLETTGVDVEADRIVTACVVECGGGPGRESLNWLADPGIEIPKQASNLHKVTTEHARAHGRPAAEVVEEVITTLAESVDVGRPLVVMNANYDLTLLDREARRYGLEPLTSIVGGRLRVIDPRILDKQIDRKRKGQRRLEDLCQHYEVALDGAHSADADAIAACRVAWRIGSIRPELAALSLDELHTAQVTWAQSQNRSLRAYFARTPGKQHMAAGVREEWPYVPLAGVSA